MFSNENAADGTQRMHGKSKQTKNGENGWTEGEVPGGLSGMRPFLRDMRSGVPKFLIEECPNNKSTGI